MDNKYKRKTYVSIGKPLDFKKFEQFTAPTGWYRIDILQNKIRTDKEFSSKFNNKELLKILMVKQ